MGKYVIKRIGLMTVTLLVIATITFFLMHTIKIKTFNLKS